MNRTGEWIKGTGAFEWGELSAQDPVLKHFDKSQKYLGCISAGTVAFSSNVAYGEWEFIIYRYNSGTNPRYQFISLDTEGGVSSGYYIFINGGRIELWKSGSRLCYTANGYLENGILYLLKITRTLDGEFTVYIKGGAFGNDDWTLVDVTGGLGTNPVTDTTYTESKYFVLDLDVGDRVGNISIKNLVKQ